MPKTDALTNGSKNKMMAEDERIHGWYRFVLGYPPHLVREYLKKLDIQPGMDWVYDPFTGTATTPVEARLQGYPTISTDANPISLLATNVKLSWEIDLDATKTALDGIMESARANPNLDANKILSDDAKRVLPHGFISEKPLIKVMAVRTAIEKSDAAKETKDFMRLALANTIITDAGNIKFGPEVYSTKPKEDANVLEAFDDTALQMVRDLQAIRSHNKGPYPSYYVFREDARELNSLRKCPQISAVITSPPYPNEKDYTRSTRLESVLLGLISSKQELRDLKSMLLRSNTRNVFVTDDDHQHIMDIPSVVKVAKEIEDKRLELGKTSGFERLYHRVTLLYFGGMYRHLKALYPRLRPGAKCAYVVGDQMSYFRVHIKTAELLRDVAVKAGYEVEGIELWRTRKSTVTKYDLEENVLIIKRPFK